MKVLFLDVDGVLNDSLTEERTPTGYLGIDAEKVALLSDVLESTHADIVLSSTWRNHPELRAYLTEKLGPLAARIISKTPNLSPPVRGAEIRKWLEDAQEVSAFAIVDDMDCLGFDGRFVKTSMAQGLTKHHCDKLKELLK